MSRKADGRLEEKIQLAQELLAESHEDKDAGQRHLSQRQIAIIVSKTTNSYVSQQTVSNWNKADLSKEARSNRLERRVWNKVLLEWMEMEVVGLVFYGCLHHLDTSTAVVIQYIRKRFE
jgi:hypothetical protein